MKAGSIVVVTDKDRADLAAVSALLCPGYNLHGFKSWKVTITHAKYDCSRSNGKHIVQRSSLFHAISAIYDDFGQKCKVSYPCV